MNAILNKLKLLAGIAAFAVAGAGVLWTLTTHQAHCTGDLVAAETRVEAAMHELQSVAVGDKVAQCAAYRHVADALTAAAPIVNICGTSQFKSGPAYEAPEAGAGYYSNLVAKQCG